jgi:hypothetical protein
MRKKWTMEQRLRAHNEGAKRAGTRHGLTEQRPRARTMKGQNALALGTV